MNGEGTMRTLTRNHAYLGNEFRRTDGERGHGRGTGAPRGGPVLARTYVEGVLLHRLVHVSVRGGGGSEGSGRSRGWLAGRSRRQGLQKHKSVECVWLGLLFFFPVFLCLTYSFLKYSTNVYAHATRAYTYPYERTRTPNPYEHLRMSTFVKLSWRIES
jgi:hypothetical protein